MSTAREQFTTSDIQTQTSRRIDRGGAIVGRAVLGLLAAIHLVLPFTPANEHDELQIYLAAVVIGSFFAYLIWMSFGRPRRALVVGAVMFVAVEAVAAVTGASPLTEGWAVKLALTAAYAYAIVANTVRRAEPHREPAVR